MTPTPEQLEAVQLALRSWGGTKTLAEDAWNAVATLVLEEAAKHVEYIAPVIGSAADACAAGIRALKGNR